MTAPSTAQVRSRKLSRPLADELPAEIARLAREEVSPGEFHQELLKRVVSSLGALGGAVWLRGEGGKLDLAGEVNLRATGLLDDPDYRTRHGRLVQKVLAKGEGTVVQQRAVAKTLDGQERDELMLLFGPLKHEEQTLGLLEIFQTPVEGGHTSQDLLRSVLAACEAASEFQFESDRAAPTEEDRHTLSGMLAQFTKAVHAELSPRATAYTIANEGRRLIGCDRVTVAVFRGRKCRVEAVSGQDLFDQRANQVRRLARLATTVAAAGEPLWFTGDTRDLPPQLERAAQSYADLAQSKTVIILPLYRSAQPPSPRERRRPLGAIIIEQIEDTTPRDGFRQRVEVVRDHAGMALGNALEYHSLFLLPLWRFFGKLGLVVKFRALPKTLMVLTLVAAIVAGLVLVPCDFDLEGRGTLQPVVRQDVFARIDGQIFAVHVKHLEPVTAGMPLAEMRSSELDHKITELEGNIGAKQQELQGLETVHLSERRTLTPAEEKQLTGRKQEIKATLASLHQQLKLQRERKTDLIVRSPLAGTVTTLDVRDRLIARPVRRGDALVSVADLKSEWELEVRMPEDRMGHILEARAAQERQRREQPGLGLPPDLKVKFILATDPGMTFEGVVKEIHQRAEVRGDEGNTVLIKVAIDKNELPQLRPGATVIAKVHCGQRSVGYAWFHDVIEFVQSRILFRF